MNHHASDYNLKAIRDQLLGSFTAESTASGLGQAKHLVEQGSYDEAIHLLQRLYRIHPHNEELVGY